METIDLVKKIETVLDDKKAQQITRLDVQGRTSVCDYMIVVTGTSGRHLKALSDYVVEKLDEDNIRPLGVEGDTGSDWVLLDLGDVLVHLMTQQARDYYQLEKLWSVPAAAEAQSSTSALTISA